MEGDGVPCGAVIDVWWRGNVDHCCEGGGEDYTFDGRSMVLDGVEEVCRAVDDRVVHLCLGVCPGEVVGGRGVNDCFEGRVGLKGGIKGVAVGNVFDDGVGEVSGVRTAGEDFLSFGF